jgi:hypothetical protein
MKDLKDEFNEILVSYKIQDNLSKESLIKMIESPVPDEELEKIRREVIGYKKDGILKKVGKTRRGILRNNFGRLMKKRISKDYHDIEDIICLCLHYSYEHLFYKWEKIKEYLNIDDPCDESKKES